MGFLNKFVEPNILSSNEVKDILKLAEELSNTSRAVLTNGALANLCRTVIDRDEKIAELEKKIALLESQNDAQ